MATVVELGVFFALVGLGSALGGIAVYSWSHSPLESIDSAFVAFEMALAYFWSGLLFSVTIVDDKRRLLNIPLFFGMITVLFASGNYVSSLGGGALVAMLASLFAGILLAAGCRNHRWFVSLRGVYIVYSICALLAAALAFYVLSQGLAEPGARRYLDLLLFGMLLGLCAWIARWVKDILAAEA